jgi:AraC-like DNA-binding protein
MITEAVFAAQPEPWRMVQQDNEQVPEVEESIEISDTDGDVTAMNVQSQAFLTMVQHVILEHLDNSELDGKTLGKIIGMSPSQLYRKLNVLTGSSTGRYIHQIRLQEAQKLLGKKELSISDIAYMTGFADPAYFSRLFTKAFGASPKSFRN